MVTKTYLSSTFQDLQECRAAAQLALQRLGVDVFAFDAFTATQGPAIPKILAQVANSDIYLGIFAWQYGFISPSAPLSGMRTHKQDEVLSQLALTLARVCPSST